MNLDKISSYLEKDPQIKKFTIKDVGTIYKDSRYTSVVCNTIDGNKDIYFGTPNFETDLIGNYCGKYNYSIFTKTYNINNIIEDDDEEYLNISFSIFQGETSQVRIKKIIDFKSNKAYEFKFKTSTAFEDTIQNVFNNSQIIEVKETEKRGLDQINESLFVE